MLDKFTGIRLSPDMKDRINKIRHLGKNEQSFSDVLRQIALRGLYSLENETFLICQESNIDLRVIAQKHELGEKLTFKELGYIAGHVYLSFVNNNLFSLRTINSINEAFMSVIMSQPCIINNGYIIEKIKIYNLIDPDTHTSTENSSDNIRNAILKTCENIKNRKINWQNYNEISRTEGMAKILDYCSSSKDNVVLDHDKFYEALSPYLKNLISVAKRSSFEKNEVNSFPIHYYNLPLFINENNFDDMQSYSNDDFFISFFFNSDRPTFYIKFFIDNENKNGLLSTSQHFSVGEMNDLINIASYYSIITDSARGKYLYLRGKLVSANIACEDDHASFVVFLSSNGAQTAFSAPRWEQFVKFLIEYEKKFAQQFSAIRYQYGDY